MTKKVLYILFLTIICVVTAIVYDYNHVTRKEYAKMIAAYSHDKKHSSYKNEKQGEGEKEGELPPNEYFKRQYSLEMNPRTGKTSPENIEALKQKKTSQVKFFKVPGESNEMAWVERGPDNIGGRTRVLFFDPNDVTGKRVFAGGVSGGLWVNNNITDVNSLWTQVGIDENLSITCFAIDPNDANIWYIGTGESFTHNDGTGNGLWISTNGGSTWQQMISVNFDNSEIARTYFINKIIAWNNAGTTELFVAFDGAFDYDFVGYGFSGWFKLNNNTGSFSRVDFNVPVENTPYVFSDVEVAVDNSMWFATKNNVYGHGGGKIFRSTDGVNFTEKHTFSNGARVELTVSKQNANVIYAIAEVSEGVELVKTINGTDFNQISKPNDVDADISANDFTRGQAFYDLMLEVDPNNDNILYAGGIDLFRSTNAGANWSQISKWSNNNNLSGLNVSLVHADQHALTFNPLNSNQGVFGNDGGVYYSSNLSSAGNSNTAISNTNKNYNVTQLYSAAIGQDKNNETFLGGAQDNGSLFVSGANVGINSYSDLYGGDGAQVFVDKDGDYAIVSYVYNTYSAQPLPVVSLNSQIEIAEDQDSGDFINIADLDDHLDILYTNGTNDSGEKISRFTNLTTSPVRQNFTSNLLSESPTAIKVSPFTTTSSTVFIGTETGVMLKVTGFNTNSPVWNNIDVLETINVGAISDIAFGKNEDEIVVTLHNYGINNIYYTSDGGVNWREKDGNLPDIPTKAVLMNPLDENEVIVGTNFGVWSTDNFMDNTPDWIRSQNGMSSVKVTQFDTRTSDNTVIASTYGRGFFTGQFAGDDLSIAENVEANNDLQMSSVVKQGILEIKSLSKLTQIVHVSIYRPDGAILLSKELNFKMDNSHTVEVPFQAGVYIVTLSYGNKHTSKKIIIIN
ncbi:T9SS type A sorting domain-containing protein [Wenyingzhuangia sp. IMCC45467]